MYFKIYNQEELRTMAEERPTDRECKCLLCLLGILICIQNPLDALREAFLTFLLVQTCFSILCARIDANVRKFKTKVHQMPIIFS